MITTYTPFFAATATLAFTLGCRACHRLARRYGS